MSHPRQPARRRRLLSGLALGLAVAATAATATACSGGSSGLGSPDTTTLRVGVVDSLGVVPFEIGISASYHSFSDAGLAITEQKFASEDDEMAALAQSKIDIAYGEYSQFLSGGDDAPNLKFPDATTLIGAVARGQVSAAALQEPYVTAGEIDANLRVAIDLGTGNAADVPVDGYFATSSFVTKFPHTTAIFASVMAKLQAVGGQRIAVETALKTQAGNDPLVTATMQLGSYPTVVLPAKL